MPNGTLVECYDELGTRYTIPVYCLSFPVNLVSDERGDRDSPAEFSEPVAQSGGRELKIRVRISLTGDDIVLIVNSAETVASAKKKLQEAVKNSDINHVSKSIYNGNLNTVETRIPNKFGIQMVHGRSVLEWHSVFEWSAILCSVFEWSGPKTI